MIVQCPSCASRYRVNDANIPASGGKIRCPSCQHAFVVYPEVSHEDDADKTSVAAQPNLREILNHMQNRGAQQASEEEVARTEVMSGAQLPNYGEMFGGGQETSENPEDATVEMANPLNMINDLFRQDKAQVVEDEINTAEINADLIQKSIAKVRAQGGSIVGEQAPPATPPQPPAPKYLNPQPPAPRFHTASNPALPPALPPRPAVGPPQIPGAAPRGRSFGETPAPQDLFGADPIPAMKPFGDSSPGRSMPFGESKSSPSAFPHLGSEHTSSPSRPGIGTDSGAFRSAGPQTQEDPHPVFAPAEPVKPTPNPEHGGPWKLQTNFGLTYEFPDTKGLRSWLSNRDELDGFMLSGDGENFFALESFPQLKAAPSSARRSGNFSSQSGLMDNPLNPVGSGALPGPSTSGLIDSPFQTASGQRSFTERAPLPVPAAAATGPKINTDAYRPPSREEKWNGVIWGVAGVLIVVCVALILQVSGIYDVKALILGPDAPPPVVTQPGPSAAQGQAPVADAETEAERRARQREQVDRMLEDAEVDMSSNRLSSAIDRLNSARAVEPDRVKVYEMLAEAHEKLGQVDQAEAMRETAQELREQDAEPETPEEDEG